LLAHLAPFLLPSVHLILRDGYNLGGELAHLFKWRQLTPFGIWFFSHIFNISMGRRAYKVFGPRLYLRFSRKPEAFWDNILFADELLVGEALPEDLANHRQKTSVVIVLALVKAE